MEGVHASSDGNCCADFPATMDALASANKPSFSYENKVIMAASPDHGKLTDCYSAASSC